MYNQYHNQSPASSPAEWDDGLDNFLPTPQPTYDEDGHDDSPPHSPCLASSSRSDPSYDAPRRPPEPKRAMPSPPIPGFYNMSSLPPQYRHHISDGNEEQSEIPSHYMSHHFVTSNSSPGFHTPPQHQQHNGAHEDEPSDVLVWNTIQQQQQQGHRHQHLRLPAQQQHYQSHHDTEDSRPSLRCASNRAISSKSRSVKSLGVRESSNGNLTSEEYENHLVSVTKQLEQIKSTQDSILSELSDDISNLQFENVQLKNTNEHLTMQNSHLLQVITDLSNEVEHMRDVFRMRGWSVKQLGEKNTVADSESRREKADSSSLSQDNKTINNNDKVEAGTAARTAKDHPTTDVPLPRSGAEEGPHVKRKQRGSSRPQEQFETVPLVENPKQKSIFPPATTPVVKNNQHNLPPVPGEEQVASLANSNSGHSSRHSSSSRRRQRGHQPKVSSKLSSVESLKSCSSRPSLSTTAKQPRSKTTHHHKNHPEDHEDDKASGGSCFKNLFKRNKRQSQTSSTSANNVR